MEREYYKDYVAMSDLFFGAYVNAIFYVMLQIRKIRR